MPFLQEMNAAAIYLCVPEERSTTLVRLVFLARACNVKLRQSCYKADKLAVAKGL